MYVCTCACVHTHDHRSLSLMCDLTQVLPASCLSKATSVRPVADLTSNNSSVLAALNSVTLKVSTYTPPLLICTP